MKGAIYQNEHGQYRRMYSANETALRTLPQGWKLIKEYSDLEKLAKDFEKLRETEPKEVQIEMKCCYK